jgi:hypothetical protein
MTRTPYLAALALAAIALLPGAARADSTWVRIGHTNNPSAAFDDSPRTADLAITFQGSGASTCIAACVYAELRARALKGAATLYNAQAFNNMSYAIVDANGQALSAAQIQALGQLQFKFGVVGQPAMPALGRVGFGYTVMVLPSGHAYGAGRSYSGANETNATGLHGASQLTQFHLDDPVPTVANATLPAEMNGHRFAVGVPASSVGVLEWTVKGDVADGANSQADYKLVLNAIHFTGVAPPKTKLYLQFPLDQDQIGFRPVTPPPMSRPPRP